MEKGKWHSTDGWRGHEVPAYAVAGSSDTGMWSDSPAPSDQVAKELRDLKDHLLQQGIGVRSVTTRRSNVFMVKRWLVVSKTQYRKAIRLVDAYLQNHLTRYIHDAK